MIDLYTWSTPNGRKASIALEELGLDYATHPIDITAGEQHEAAFLRVSPNNRIPAIVDRETDLALMESGAILLYLAEKAGRLMPREGEARWRCLEWLMWQMGGLGPMAGQTHHFVRFNRGKSAYAEERYAGETRRLYGVLDRRLADAPRLAGDDYSIADIAAWPWIARFAWQQIDLADFPNVRRWYLEIAEREAVQRGYRVPRDEAVPMP